MSLRGRLLVLMMLLNVVVLGVISVTALVIQDRWMDRVTTVHREYVARVVVPAAHTRDLNSLTAIAAIHDLLDVPFRDWFQDLMIRSSATGGYVDINPLGASHRDHTVFPYDEVSEGIGQAIRDGTRVLVAGGICVAIPSLSGEDVGGVWFVPAVPDAPRVSLWAYAIPLSVSFLVFVLLAGWIVGRTLGPPIEQLGSAARRVESGDYTARVPPLASAPELATVVDAFNAMATKVEGHTLELEREVQRATEEAAAKERALVVSSRLASMGTLAAGIAHEINNPIGGMLNAAHRLASGMASGTASGTASGEGRSDRDRKYLELIQQGLARVARTSRKLLDFTPRVIDPIAFRLRDAVDGAYALVEHALQQQRVEFRVELPEDLPMLLGDPHEIQQVLLNLFLNSLHAMRDGRDARDRPGHSIEVRAETAGTGVAIHVVDDGPGVDSATLDQVMNPFFSGSNRPDATGLGLFISFTIIHNHGGEMRVYSAPDEGFRVTIELPGPMDSGPSARPGRTEPGGA